MLYEKQDNPCMVKKLACRYHLVELTVHDFMSYSGEYCFRFRKGFNVILCSSGVALDDFVNALEFVLFGDVVGSVRGLINQKHLAVWKTRGIEPECGVSVVFNVDGVEYKCRRRLVLSGSGFRQLIEVDQGFTGAVSRGDFGQMVVHDYDMAAVPRSVSRESVDMLVFDPYPWSFEAFGSMIILDSVLGWLVFKSRRELLGKLRRLGLEQVLILENTMYDASEFLDLDTLVIRVPHRFGA